MATLGPTVRTLLDVAKSLNPDGSVAKVAEILTQTNEILLDMPATQGNLPTGNRTTVRTGLPAVYFRLLNAGVPPSKSTKAQVDDQCGKMEAWSVVDCAVAELSGDVGATRLSESKAFLEAMNQKMASTVFYGAASSPEQFVGFAPRYSSLSAGNAQNILDGGGTGTDNTSIWLVGWSEDTVTGIYPKGSTAGLRHKDLGEQTVTVTTGIGGTLMRAYQDQYIWDMGIAVKDWRYAVRICNIDVSNLVSQSSAAALTNFMIKAMRRIPSLGIVRPAFYMNRTVLEMLDIQRRNDVSTGGQLKYEQVDGVWTPMFRSIPIRQTDALLLTEARVT